MPLAAGNPEAIEIPQTESGRLKAVLFRPEGTGPFPAVVGLHNCTGLNNRSGAMGARYRDWGQRLAKAGFVVLFPDSNGSRGLGSQCGVRKRPAARRPRARRRRQRRPRLAAIAIVGRADRVSLLGWSNGAIAALWAVRRAPQAKDGARFPFRGRALSGLPAAQQRRLERAGADADPDRARRRPGLGRDLPADGGGRARPQRAGRDPRLSRRAPRLRPSEPAAAGAHRPGVFGRRQRPRATAAPIRPPAPTRSSACRRGWRGSESVPTARTPRPHGSASRCRRAISSAGR